MAAGFFCTGGTTTGADILAAGFFRTSGGTTVSFSESEISLVKSIKRGWARGVSFVRSTTCLCPCLLCCLFMLLNMYI